MSAVRARGFAGLASTCSVLLGAACTSISDPPFGMMTSSNAMPVAGEAPAAAAGTRDVAPAAAAVGGRTGGVESIEPPMAPNAGSGTAGVAAGGGGRSEGVAGASPMQPVDAGAMRAGAGGAAGQAGDAGIPMAASDAGMTLSAGPRPQLPAIRGACPEFRDGTTIMVAGHAGIFIAAGARGKGGALLFYWHGTGGKPAEEMMGINPAARSEIIESGGIIAAFDGSKSSGAGADCSGTKAHNEADFNAADQIAACAVEAHGIDPRRIYTTGCSSGGLQSGCMALMRSSYLAAAATNSGGLLPPQVAVVEWQDKHSPAILTVHGGASDQLSIMFSETSAALDMSAKTHGSFVANCNHGGGHCGMPADMKLAAWQFMKDHPWGFEKSPWAAGIPAGVPQYCKVY